VVFLAAQDVAALSPTLKSVDAQAEHVASALAEPAVKYVPAAHDAVRVWHGPKSLAAENWVLLHSAHPDCSLVASLSDSQVEPWPAAHCVWSWQAERSSFKLNWLSASVQLSHWMSAVVEASADLPWPAGQVDHAAHSVTLPAASVKVCAGQPVQAESVVLSAETARNWPAGHGAVFAAHSVALPAAAGKCVAAQAVQVASALAGPAVKYSPAGHVVFLAAQVVKSLSPTLKSVVAQPVQVASAVLSDEAVKYSPATHVVFLVVHDVSALSPTLKSVAAQPVQVASALTEPAVKYCPAAQVVVRREQGP
jgi:hypothetical protein